MKQSHMLIIAIVLIVIAVAAIGWQVTHQGDNRTVTTKQTAADIQKEIDDIQNNPHMPQRAKDMAIGQIKSRAGGLGAPTKQ